MKTKKNLSSKILGLIINFVTVVASCYYANLLLLHSQFGNGQILRDFYATNNLANLTSIAIFFLIIILFSSITGSPIIGSGIVLILAEIFAFVNANKLSARQAPLYPEELKMISETKSLASMVSKNDILHLIVKIVIIILVAVIIIRLFHRFNLRLNKKPRRIIRAVSFILILFPVWNIKSIANSESKASKFLIARGTNIVNWGWNQPGNYSTNGFLLGFIFNAVPQPIMDEPDGYSKTAIENIIDKYQNDSKIRDLDTNKNVVFVLSESFADPNDVSSEVTPSKDPIPFIHSIMENNTSGHILVSEYGGGTANMEFDLLTGFSTSTFTGIPYQDIVPKNNDFPSFVKVLENYGYSATAIHPFDGNMYKRSTVYPNLGINNFIDIRSMDYSEKIGKSKFISDASAYNQVLDVLKKGENKQFIQLVTMQNHQPYWGGVYDDPITISSDKLSGEAKTKISTYWTGLSYTDQSTEKFIKSLDALPEDTIVVFFGDHYPGQNVFGDIFTGEINDYLTPYFIYDTSNPTAKMAADDITSLNFIQLKVMQHLGKQNTPFMNLISAVNGEWAAISRTYGVDSEGNTTTSQNLSGDAFKDYQLINYDLVEGKKYSLKSNFYLTN